jgi:predicted O-methyltransferase YrrM
MAAETKFRMHREIVLTLYQRLLDRSPGSQEAAYWLEFLQNNSFADTYDAFLSSAEFKSRQGVQPGHPVGHYYSPVVDPRTIDVAKLDSPLSASDFEILGLSLPRMQKFWQQHLHIIASSTFPRTATSGHRYYLDNPVFSYADALMLRTMLIVYKPSRVIEIGGGFSTAVMLDTADECGLKTRFTIVDPYPETLRTLLLPRDLTNVEIVEKPVQHVDLALFSPLCEYDILFIDSTHVLKTQSDVCREFFDILPSLKKGVLIHFHDIFYPFEYPRSWIFDARYSWNELYGLRLFLMYNKRFETLFFNNMFGKLEEQTIQETCPLYLENIGGSFWMRKLAE